jgi:hypothetical protein
MASQVPFTSETARTHFTRVLKPLFQSGVVTASVADNATRKLTLDALPIVECPSILRYVVGCLAPPEPWVKNPGTRCEVQFFTDYPLFNQPRTEKPTYGRGRGYDSHASITGYCLRSRK